jgi:uncharacterized membrane protein required for colicin V production
VSDLSFSFVDVLVVAILLVSAVYAAYRGFVSETLSIFAWIAAAFATLYFGPALALFLHERMSPAWLSTACGYGLVFLLIFIPLSFVSYRFAQGVRQSPVGGFDRVLGFAFGIVRGLAIIGLIYFVFSAFVHVKDQPVWVQQARTLPLIQRSTQALLSLVPSHMRVLPVEKAQAAPAELMPGAGRHDRPSAYADDASAQKPQPDIQKKRRRKTYGARDRQALDSLIEATGSGGNKNP